MSLDIGQKIKQLFRLSRTAEKVVTQESVEKYLHNMLDMLPTTNQDVLRLIFETFLDHVELSASEIKIFLKIYASDNAHKTSKPLTDTYLQIKDKRKDKAFALSFLRCETN